MATPAWGHRERLLAVGLFGVVLAACGAVAMAAGATSGFGIMLAGTAVTCWEALGLWLLGAYRRWSAER
ncbi:hypothetical protein [Streptomyces ipomoeae]|uniref:hypothetical protein n=1 Tax=Streptomyces ipomoeae TaxID=103232 RepID=UPI001147280D|nr:hypothetical protein [Streptomyces ipomoeae]MDX2933440.1 hypothetical protein [Streptomyces ipomoeae]TQE20292.1 hypothetical protein SipoB123_28600 [Streptomyces ipomoeae]